MKILGVIFLFCLIGTLVWILLSIGGLAAFIGWSIIIAAIVCAAYAVYSLLFR